MWNGGEIEAGLWKQDEPRDMPGPPPGTPRPERHCRPGPGTEGCPRPANPFMPVSDPSPSCRPYFLRVSQPASAHLPRHSPGPSFRHCHLGHCDCYLTGLPPKASPPPLSWNNSFLLSNVLLWRNMFIDPKIEKSVMNSMSLPTPHPSHHTLIINPTPSTS